MRINIIKVVSIVVLLFSQQVLAFMPVFDPMNLAESVKQTYQQIAQGKIQLDQYKRMLENSKTLDSYTWDQANITMDNLMNSINTLDYYKQQMGGLDGYLSRYQTVDHYKNAACLNGNGCTPAQLQALQQQSVDASNAQKRANDAQLRGIDQQQRSMKADANTLRRLQQDAQGATGQMQALQAANQLASAETNQLLQIRGLLVSSQNAEATRASAVADREAIQAAADARFRAGKFRKSPPRSW
jgi:P-type conjugative transfer protein TrbJ